MEFVCPFPLASALLRRLTIHWFVLSLAGSVENCLPLGFKFESLILPEGRLIVLLELGFGGFRHAVNQGIVRDDEVLPLPCAFSLEDETAETTTVATTISTSTYGGVMENLSADQLGRANATQEGRLRAITVCVFGKVVPCRLPAVDSREPGVALALVAGGVEETLMGRVLVGVNLS